MRRLRCFPSVQWILTFRKRSWWTSQKKAKPDPQSSSSPPSKNTFARVIESAPQSSSPPPARSTSTPVHTPPTQAQTSRAPPPSSTLVASSTHTSFSFAYHHPQSAWHSTPNPSLSSPPIQNSHCSVLPHPWILSFTHTTTSHSSPTKKNHQSTIPPVSPGETTLLPLQNTTLIGGETIRNRSERSNLLPPPDRKTLLYLFTTPQPLTANTPPLPYPQRYSNIRQAVHRFTEMIPLNFFPNLSPTTFSLALSPPPPLQIA